MIEKQNHLTDFPHLVYQKEYDGKINAGQCDCAYPHRLADIQSPGLLTNSSYLLPKLSDFFS